MENCNQKLKELIVDVVLADIEDRIDEIFAVVAKDKTKDEIDQDELNDLHELRDEFKTILEEIESGELSLEECKEIYNDIQDMISDDEQ